MVEDIDDPVVGPHEHVDLIYFCRLRDRQGDGIAGLRSGWTWVSEEALSAGASISMDNGMVVTPPEDVRQLALGRPASGFVRPVRAALSSWLA